MCVSGWAAGREGSVDSDGAGVLMVAGDSSSLILEESHHHATVLINHM